MSDPVPKRVSFHFLVEIFRKNQIHHPSSHKSKPTTTSTTTQKRQQQQTMYTKTIALLFALAGSVSADGMFRPSTKIHHVGDAIETSGTGLRRMQDNCDAQLDTLNGCVSSSCATCLNNAFDAVLALEGLTCGRFESDMCQAIQNDCPACSRCEAQAEEYYECIARRATCTSFQCPSSDTLPTPTSTQPTEESESQPTESDGDVDQPNEGSGSCGLNEFDAYCTAVHGTSAQAACIIV